MQSVSLSSLLLLLTACPVLAERDLSGVYLGTIMSGGEFSGTTELKTTNTTTTGSYRFGPPGGIEEGILFNCSLQGLVLRCMWSDAYGNGDLVLRFEEGFCSFEGSWYTDTLPQAKREPDDGHYWSGNLSRKDCAARDTLS